jgi:hypothetical protein
MEELLVEAFGDRLSIVGFDLTFNAFFDVVVFAVGVGMEKIDEL